MFSSIPYVPITTISHSGIPEKDWDLLRLDMIHPIVSGNKLFKLRPWIDQAKKQGKTGILTFGGAWSNHIVASAYASREAGLSSVGMIRGGEFTTTTMAEARSYGMVLQNIDRATYRQAREDQFQSMGSNHPGYLVVPEGGYGLPGARGAADILRASETKAYTHIICACGTGTMLAGLIGSAAPGQICMGISIVRQGQRQLDESIRSLISAGPYPHWTTLHDHDLGGYAKHNRHLIAFMNKFHEEHGVPSDIVYTGKLFLAMETLTSSGFFPMGSKLLAIHSGGLQGNRSLAKGELAF
jgi:1-aminocyclopropane-1-carboxylate deaminase